MNDKSFDVVEPGLRALDEKTMQPIEMDWHRAIDIMLGLMVQHGNPTLVVKQTQTELHRLADAYMLALGWMELLKSQRDDAREAYEAARNALDDMPRYESKLLEYHDPDDVARVMQMMHQTLVEWNPPVN